MVTEEMRAAGVNTMHAKLIGLVRGIDYGRIAEAIYLAMKSKEAPSDATQRMATILGCEFVPNGAKAKETVLAGDVQLPCDVQLPPATTIRAGCKLSTLIHALELRGMPTAIASMGDAQNQSPTNQLEGR